MVCVVAARGSSLRSPQNTTGVVWPLPGPSPGFGSAAVVRVAGIAQPLALVVGGEGTATDHARLTGVAHELGLEVSDHHGDLLSTGLHRGPTAHPGLELDKASLSAVAGSSKTRSRD